VAGLKRVARLADGWLASGYNTTPELFAQAWSDVQAEVAARGRDVARFPNGIATMWCYVTEERARADAVLTDVLAPMLNRPVEQLRAKLPIGSAEECAGKLLAYARATATGSGTKTSPPDPGRRFPSPNSPPEPP